MEDPLSEARAVFERWHDAFNNRDLEGQVAAMHFPHIRLSGQNRFMTWATAEEFRAEQDALTARLQAEGWDHSENLRFEPVQVGPEKVHVALRESRVHADRSEYNGFDTFWIFTKVDGRWGLQFRSSFLAGAAQAFTEDVQPS